MCVCVSVPASTSNSEPSKSARSCIPSESSILPRRLGLCFCARRTGLDLQSGRPFVRNPVASATVIPSSCTKFRIGREGFSVPVLIVPLAHRHTPHTHGTSTHSPFGSFPLHLLQSLVASSPSLHLRSFLLQHVHFLSTSCSSLAVCSESQQFRSVGLVSMEANDTGDNQFYQFQTWQWTDTRNPFRFKKDGRTARTSYTANPQILTNCSSGGDFKIPAIGRIDRNTGNLSPHLFLRCLISVHIQFDHILNIAHATTDISSELQMDVAIQKPKSKLPEYIVLTYRWRLRQTRPVAEMDNWVKIIKTHVFGPRRNDLFVYLNALSDMVALLQKTPSGSMFFTIPSLERRRLQQSTPKMSYPLSDPPAPG